MRQQINVRIGQTTQNQLAWLTERYGSQTQVVVVAIDRLYESEQRSDMSNAKFYVEIATFYANAPSFFFGPYPTREAAEAAVSHTDGPSRADLAQRSDDIRYGTQCLAIHTTTQARANGMSRVAFWDGGNCYPAQPELPGNKDVLTKLLDSYDA